MPKKSNSRRLFISVLASGVLFSLVAFAGPLNDVARALFYSGSRGGIKGSRDFRPILEKVREKGRLAEFTQIEFPVEGSETFTVRGITNLTADNSQYDRHLLFYYGSGENIATLLNDKILEKIMAQFPGRTAITVVDYPGYGASEGRASEVNLVAMGKETLRYVNLHYAVAEKTIIVSHSLGTAVAMPTAATSRDYRAVVLLNPFDSNRSLLGKWKSDFLLPDTYDSVSYADQIDSLVIVSHGHPDGIVPYKNGVNLWEALTTPTKVFLPNKYGHSAVIGAEGEKAMSEIWSEIVAQLF